MSWTEQDLVDLARKRQQQAPTSKPSKYRNQKTTVDNIVFDSKKEAARYQSLSVLARLGQVRGLQRQVLFALTAGPQVVIGHYRADFVYDRLRDQDWVTVVEDVKGGRATKTALYQWKKRHFEAEYGRTIRET